MSEATRDDFFAALEKSPGKETFTLPGGKMVYIEEPSALEIEQFQAACARAAADDETSWDMLGKARLVALCVTDGKGKQLLSGEDVKRLMRGRNSILEPIYRICLRLAGLDAATMETLRKNSEDRQSFDSCSVSAETPDASTLEECSAN